MTQTRTRMVLVAGLALSLGAATAQAHDMWVNATAAHDPDAGATAVVVSMGWGHAPLPIAEFINGAQMQTYAVIAPDGSVMALPFDAAQNANVNIIPGDDALPGLTDMQGGDTFARRLTFDGAAAAGAWRAHAGLPHRVYSTWTNAEGETVSGAQFADEIEGAAEIVSTAVTVRSSDTFWPIGAWSTPTPADVPLQLIPQTDLSKVAAGDEVTFAVYRDGARITPPEDATFAAFSANAEAAGSVEDNGDLRVTLSAPGVWIVRSSHLEDLPDAGPAYADLEGRIDAVTFTATSAVHVGP